MYDLLAELLEIVDEDIVRCRLWRTLITSKLETGAHTISRSAVNQFYTNLCPLQHSAKSTNNTTR